MSGAMLQATSTRVRAVDSDAGEQPALEPTRTSPHLLSALLLAQYLPFALLPALLSREPGRTLVLQLLGSTLAWVFVLELVLSAAVRSAGRRARRPPRASTAPSRPLLGTAVAVASVGLLTAVLAAFAGLGSIGGVVGARQPSAFAVLLTPLRPWTIFGAALLMLSHRRGELGRRPLRAALGLLLVGEAFSAVRGAIMAPLAAYAFTVLVLALLMGVVRSRLVVGTVLLVVLLWPTFYAMRNTQRLSYGVAADAHVGAYDRLRMDRLIARAQELPQPLRAGQPGAATVLRYGLVPRFLDADRPPLGVGQRLNLALGGSARSSYSFTSVGNLYVFYGSYGLALSLGVMTLLVLLLQPLATAPRVLVMGLALHDLVWFGASLPDSAVAFLQGLVSAAVAVAGLAAAHLMRSALRAAHHRLPGGTP